MCHGGSFLNSSDLVQPRNRGGTLTVFPASLHSFAPAVPAHVGQSSDPCRTALRSNPDSPPTQTGHLFRRKPDTVPNHLGHHSDDALKTVRYRPEHCPTWIGTVSGLNRNTVRLRVGLLSEIVRNPHSHPKIMRAWKKNLRKHWQPYSERTL